MSVLPATKKKYLQAGKIMLTKKNGAPIVLNGITKMAHGKKNISMLKKHSVTSGYFYLNQKCFSLKGDNSNYIPTRKEYNLHCKAIFL